MVKECGNMKKLLKLFGIKSQEEIQKEKELEYIKLQKAVRKAAEGFWDHFLPDSRKEVKQKE